MRNGLMFAAGNLCMLALLCFTGNVAGSWHEPLGGSLCLALLAGVVDFIPRKASKRATSTRRPAAIAPAMSQLEADVLAGLQQLGAKKPAAAAAAARATKENPEADFNTVFKAAVRLTKEAHA